MRGLLCRCGTDHLVFFQVAIHICFSGICDTTKKRLVNTQGGPCAANSPLNFEHASSASLLCECFLVLQHCLSYFAIRYSLSAFRPRDSVMQGRIAGSLDWIEMEMPNLFSLTASGLDPQHGLVRFCL